jgi:hypothetical protein
MAFLEDAVNRGKVVGKKTKLKAGLLLLDRNIQTRKKQFGVDLYDALQEITCQQDFYATTDKTIASIRPLLLETDREIRALDGKKLRRKGDLDLAEAVRREAFPIPATNWKEKTANAGKSTKMAANEAKLKIGLNAIQTQMYVYKETFGLKMYIVLEDLFGAFCQPLEVHCSTDEVINKIRGGYSICKDDIMVIQRKKKEKLALIDKLDVEASLRRIG